MYQPSKLFTLPLCEGEIEPWRKALLDAAEYIQEHGLCKDGRFANRRGEVCAWGALARVSRGATMLTAFNALSKRVGIIPNWNDAPERTKEDVIRALQECARS